MARHKGNRFHAIESGSKTELDWLKLPHLQQQLKMNGLATGWMYKYFFTSDRLPNDNWEAEVSVGNSFDIEL